MHKDKENKKTRLVLLDGSFINLQFGFINQIQL
jgi:hypothetical protein